MIQIDVTMSIRSGGVATHIDDSEKAATQMSAEIYAFFKSCIDQNLILNAMFVDDAGVPLSNITKYFSTTAENAQAFETAFSDMNAEFSMKKMWDQNGFDISIVTSEIEFDTVEYLFPIIDTDTTSVHLLREIASNLQSF